MTEEIKEILDTPMFITDNEGFTIYINDKIENYITNLQKEKEELQRKYLTINENNQNMQEEMVRTWKKCDDYKQRNEKATQYIDSLFNTIDYDDEEFITFDTLKDIQDLINYGSFQGGDEE